MTILAPIILLPTNGVNYASDIPTQTLSGTTVAPNTKNILVNNSTFGVTYTSGSSIWAWSGTLPIGANNLSIIAIDQDGTQSAPTTIQITILSSNTKITVTPPTGVRLRSYQDSIEALNAQNPEPQTIGYNYYVAVESGGGSSRTYAKMNPQIVSAYTYYEDTTSPISQSVDTAGNVRVTTTTEEVIRTYYYSFTLTNTVLSALISAGTLPNVLLNQDQPFFFVITAVIYDPVLGQVTESAYSMELQGSPVTITTGLKTLPNRSQVDIILTFSQELLTGNKNVSMLPGSVIRDILDPPSEEMARVYVIQNFLAISLSVSALQDFDDANHDGISDPVSSSMPKQALKIALGLTRDQDVQNLIDSQFDALASNVDTIRKGATSAIGYVTFYTGTAPIRDMIVNQGATVTSQGDLDQGIPSQAYMTLESKTISLANAAQFYNSLTNQYEVSVQVQALTAGSTGNADSFTVTSISSGADSNFKVENPNPIAFGQDEESNHDLSTRIELAMYADTGTLGGYNKTAAGVSGVQRMMIQAAGDPLMIRDYDSLRNQHVGGKVDVYVQGQRLKQVSDQIAFSYESIGDNQGTMSGETFAVINAPAYEFKSLNPLVTAHTPIFSVSLVHNATKVQDYDITGYQIIGDGDTIKLNETLPKNVAIGLASADVIKVDYKYRSSDTYILKNQPVINIVSVVGQLSGPLTPENYELVALADPLANGNSTIATTSVRIKFANNLPLETFQPVSNEAHVMIIGKQEPLVYLGADPTTIIVRNNTSTITYSENIDYRIIPGATTTPTNILLIESGYIQNGQEVLISYTAIENFVVTYTINDLLTTVQTEMDKMKHACADVIVKQAVENNVDFAFTVVPTAAPLYSTYGGQINVYQATLRTKIGTAIGNYINRLSIGETLTQSKIIQLIQDLPEVNYMALPLNRMVKSDGSFIIRDDIGHTQFEIFNEGLVRSFITVIPVLTYATVDKGGSDNLFRGIFEDSMPLVLQEDVLDVSGGPGRGYIQADGKIVVSTKDGLLPDTKDYQVAYYVYGEKGTKDINVASVEYLTIGNLAINFDTPQD